MLGPLALTLLRAARVHAAHAAAAVLFGASFGGDLLSLGAQDVVAVTGATAATMAAAGIRSAADDGSSGESMACMQGNSADARCEGRADAPEEQAPCRCLPARGVSARPRRIQGTVVLGLTVDAAGRVAAWELVHSSGSALLDAAARRAATRWRFDRGPGVVEQPFTFRLATP